MICRMGLHSEYIYIYIPCVYYIRWFLFLSLSNERSNEIRVKSIPDHKKFSENQCVPKISIFLGEFTPEFDRMIVSVDCSVT